MPVPAPARSTPVVVLAVLASLLGGDDGFAPGARLDRAGMANVLAIRSEYGRPRKHLGDVSRYIDESILQEALQ